MKAKVGRHKLQVVLAIMGGEEAGGVGADLGEAPLGEASMQ